MSKTGDFWKQVQKTSKAQNVSPVQVGTVTSKSPLSISFNGLDIGTQYGDTIYINHLLLDDNIDLDLGSLDQAQTINPALWQADNSPTSSVQISGTQKQFLTDFYNYFKQWQKRYIIEIGDFVAVQKLGKNTYIILQKIQKHNEQ